MSWASFHVLEVMSSVKYLQKRVGYLGAVQSFRPDTEVLMLATNLLKKVWNVGITLGQLLKWLGFDFDVNNNHVPSNHNSPSHNHSLSGYVSRVRSPSTNDTLKPIDTKENDCDFVPFGSCLPGNFAACLAQNQRTPAGRGRSPKCHFCDRECSV